MKTIEYISDLPSSIKGYNEISKGMRKRWPDSICDELIAEGKAIEIPSLRYREPKKEEAENG